MPNYICVMLSLSKLKAQHIACLICLFLAGTVANAQSGELKVSSDFPGGSAEVLKIDQVNRIISIRPELNPDRGWECWWYFKLEGVNPGDTITFDINSNGWALPERAQFSYDNRTWEQTLPGNRTNRLQMVYKHRALAKTIWFAWGPPFVQKDAEELIKKLAETPYAKGFDLSRTREGRLVKGVKIAQQNAAVKKRSIIWLQARQHAWETGGSWVGRGIAEWLVSADETAVWLRKNADVYFIPIMDVDNVEIGAGGKTQKPQDHYWDWSSQPYFPETTAAMNKIKEAASSGQMEIFMDLHNPAYSDKTLLFYVPAKPLLVPERVVNQNVFFDLAKKETAGPIGFIGKLGPIGNTYSPEADPGSDCWIANTYGPDVLSLTEETPWNTPYSTQQGYMNIGAQLGRTIALYLKAKQAK